MTVLMGLEQLLKTSKLQVITDLRTGAGFGDFCRSLYEAGVDIIQVRDDSLDKPAALAALEQARTAAFENRRLLVVGRNLDVAASFGADVAHLGASDGDVVQARSRLHEHALVGRSAHTQADLQGAGANYLLVGPVYGDRVPGLDLVKQAVLAQPVTDPGALPWFAVGGITPATIAEVIAAGAVRVAVASAITAAADPAAVAAELAEQLRLRWTSDDLFAYTAAALGGGQAQLNPKES